MLLIKGPGLDRGPGSTDSSDKMEVTNRYLDWHTGVKYLLLSIRAKFHLNSKFLQPTINSQ